MLAATSPVGLTPDLSKLFATSSNAGDAGDAGFIAAVFCDPSPQGWRQVICCGLLLPLLRHHGPGGQV
jgi:hypothetical protein